MKVLVYTDPQAMPKGDKVILSTVLLDKSDIEVEKCDELRACLSALLQFDSQFVAHIYLERKTDLSHEILIAITTESVVDKVSQKLSSVIIWGVEYESGGLEGSYYALKRFSVGDRRASHTPKSQEEWSLHILNIIRNSHEQVLHEIQSLEDSLACQKNIIASYSSHERSLMGTS